MAPSVRAAVLVKPKTLEAREFARPAIGLDDALLRIESGRYPFDKMHTLSFPLEQAEDAIHALAGHGPGENPIHLAIVPGAPRVTLPR